MDREWTEGQIERFLPGEKGRARSAIRKSAEKRVKTKSVGENTERKENGKRSTATDGVGGTFNKLLYILHQELGGR